MLASSRSALSFPALAAPPGPGAAVGRGVDLLRRRLIPTPEGAIEIAAWTSCPTAASSSARATARSGSSRPVRGEPADAKLTCSRRASTRGSGSRWSTGDDLRPSAHRALRAPGHRRRRPLRHDRHDQRRLGRRRATTTSSRTGCRSDATATSTSRSTSASSIRSGGTGSRSRRGAVGAEDRSERKSEPFASGFRSPNGLGFNADGRPLRRPTTRATGCRAARSST
jgi:hypothetical protein